MNFYYKEKKIIIPVWNAPLILVDTNDDTALIKKHNINLGTMPNAHSWTIWKRQQRSTHVKASGIRKVKHYVLILNTKEKYFSNSYGTLVHESAHITGFILLDRGVKATFKNDEAFCYLIKYIFNEGLKFFF